MSERKPGGALWAALFLVAVVLLYPASFGPAVWFTARGHLHKSTTERIYWPILSGSVYGPDAVWQVTSFWGSLGVSRDDAIILEFEREDGARIQVPFGKADEWSLIPKSLRVKSRPASRTGYGGVI